MNCKANVKWDSKRGNLKLTIDLHGRDKIKAEVNNCMGQRVLQLFDKSFKKGHHHFDRHLNNLNQGMYTMKISAMDGCNVTRFRID